MPARRALDDVSATTGGTARSSWGATSRRSHGSHGSLLDPGVRVPSRDTDRFAITASAAVAFALPPERASEVRTRCVRVIPHLPVLAERRDRDIEFWRVLEVTERRGTDGMACFVDLPCVMDDREARIADLAGSSDDRSTRERLPYEDPRSIWGPDERSTK